MAASPPQPPPTRATGFIVGLFVFSLLIGVVVLYLGLSGGLGGPIPGTHPGNGISGPPSPTSCEGKDKLGNFTFSFVAGIRGSFSYNGSHPGPCVAVVVGSHVTVKFSVAEDAGQNHTWVLVNASNASTALSQPAFPGAGFSGPQRFVGIAPGEAKTFQFNATTVGAYQYICEVSGHYDVGMWGWFNVTAPGGATAVGIGDPSAPVSAAGVSLRSDSPR
ncbi:MAG: hypothetical protein L3K18_08200 [Thermoplasmata archaeon]|nr:hypothetical protein [Thermoplasmata archaeon]